jgi:hypothetical protein
VGVSLRHGHARMRQLLAHQFKMGTFEDHVKGTA